MYEISLKIVIGMITNNILHIDIKWRIFVFFSALLYSTQLNSTLLPSSMFYFCFSSMFFIPLSVYLSVSIYLCIYRSFFFSSSLTSNLIHPFLRRSFPSYAIFNMMTSPLISILPFFLSIYISYFFHQLCFHFWFYFLILLFYFLSWQGPKHIFEAEILSIDPEGRAGQILLLLYTAASTRL